MKLDTMDIKIFKIVCFPLQFIQTAEQRFYLLACLKTYFFLFIYKMSAMGFFFLN